MINDAVREKLLKIYQLSQKGANGEREAAERALNAMLAKYGIALADIADAAPSLSDFEISWATLDERRLAAQVIYSVVGDTRHIYVLRRSRRSGATCSKPEAAEIAVRWEILRRDYREQKKKFISAFIAANHLWPDDEKVQKRAEQQEEKPLTEEQRAERLRIAKMAQGIQASQIHKQIAGR